MGPICRGADTPLKWGARLGERPAGDLGRRWQGRAAQVEQARNLLLGMLGHDLRTPLQTIQMTASYLAALSDGKEVSEAAAPTDSKRCPHEVSAG